MLCICIMPSSTCERATCKCLWFDVWGMTYGKYRYTLFMKRNPSEVLFSPFHRSQIRYFSYCLLYHVPYYFVWIIIIYISIPFALLFRHRYAEFVNLHTTTSTTHNRSSICRKKLWVRDIKFRERWFFVYLRMSCCCGAAHVSAYDGWLTFKNMVNS